MSLLSAGAHGLIAYARVYIPTLFALRHRTSDSSVITLQIQSFPNLKGWGYLTIYSIREFFQCLFFPVRKHDA